MPLSKSDYMLFLRHPAWLWLKKFDKTKLPPVGPDQQAIFEAGHIFESYAEQLFENSLKLGFDNYQDYLELPTKTHQAIQSDTPVIFQGRLEAGGLTCIFDILQKVGDNLFDLIEIKASTKAKPEHAYDLAFQALVLEKAGYHIRNISVLHANKEYQRRGQVDPAGLCTQTDITSEVRALADLTLQQVAAAEELLKKTQVPDLSLRHANALNIPGVSWSQEWLEIFQSLRPSDLLP